MIDEYIGFEIDAIERGHTSGNCSHPFRRSLECDSALRPLSWRFAMPSYRIRACLLLAIQTIRPNSLASRWPHRPIAPVPFWWAHLLRLRAPDHTIWYKRVTLLRLVSARVCSFFCSPHWNGRRLSGTSDTDSDRLWMINRVRLSFHVFAWIPIWWRHSECFP